MGLDFLYHTFVLVRTLEDSGMAKPLLACLYKTLTLMLYTLINHPNLMGARRSCGQFSNTWFVSCRRSLF